LFFGPLAQRVADRDAGIDAAIARRIRALEARVRELDRRLDPHDPTRRLAERGRRLEAARGRLDVAVRARQAGAVRRVAAADARLLPASRSLVDRLRQRTALLGAHLNGNDPEAILQRGYAIVTYGDAIVRDPASVPIGDVVAARLAHGTLRARVEKDVQS
jgi:exonuclease VII large subunit